MDKRLYKGTFPTCHDFNSLLVMTDSVRLLVGFTAGQVQLIDPIKKELGKLFNEEVRKKMTSMRVCVSVNLLFNVTINDISVIYVTAHRCAGGLKKKLDLRSGSQHHRHFVGFFNVPVQTPTQDHPFCVACEA